MPAQPIAGRHPVAQPSQADLRHRIEDRAGRIRRQTEVPVTTAGLRRRIEDRAGRTRRRTEVPGTTAGLRRRIEDRAGRTRRRTEVLGKTAGLRRRIEDRAGRTRRRTEVPGKTAGLRRRIEDRAGRTRRRTEVLGRTAGLRRRIEDRAGRITPSDRGPGHDRRPAPSDRGPGRPYTPSDRGPGQDRRPAPSDRGPGRPYTPSDRGPGQDRRPAPSDRGPGRPYTPSDRGRWARIAGLRRRIEVRAGRTRRRTEVLGTTAGLRRRIEDPGQVAATRRRTEELVLTADPLRTIVVRGQVAQSRDRIATRNPDRAGSLPGVGARLGARGGLVKLGLGRVGLADARLSQQGRSVLNGEIGQGRLRTLPAGLSVANPPCVFRNRLDLPQGTRSGGYEPDSRGEHPRPKTGSDKPVDRRQSAEQIKRRKQRPGGPPKSHKP